MPILYRMYFLCAPEHINISASFSKSVRICCIAVFEIFRVVGFYKNPSNLSQPGTVIVDETSQVKEINIQVDFRNPPAQPF